MLAEKTKPLSILIALAFFLIACQPRTIPASTGHAEREVERGHLNVFDNYGLGLATTLDPHSPNRHLHYTLMAYDTLVDRDVEGNNIPALAVSWTPNEDASEWVFKLREGVLFHDGTEMKAPDVVYSLLRLLDPEINSPLIAILDIIRNVEPIGDYTVKISLDPANVDFPSLLVAYQAAIIRENGGGTIAEDGIGTGPFKLETLDFAGSTEVVAHDDYWAGSPGTASASIIAIPDSVARTQAMRSGQIDLLEISWEQAALFEGNDDFVVQVFPGGRWHSMSMRTDTPPFDDPRVRKAIRLAADREEIVAQALSGRGTVTCDHPVWTGDIYRADIDCPQDIELAKSLLAEAGYPDGLELDIHTSSIYPEWSAMLETYQAQAAEAGITINIVQRPADGYWAEVWLTESFVTTSWGERLAPRILPEAYRGGATWNETYYNNPEFDALLDAAAAEVDLEARIEIYRQLQNILWEDGGSLVPFHVDSIRVIRSCLDGVDPIGEFYMNYAKITKSGDC
ncbi:ABC transporter substrate-binding protein [Chloroflexi bacterium TSY]|nr:ABC transporter substrate-binding protein [Chloroflexi bacterium TSY]